ncbi:MULTISPECIES: hypothetical protein [Pseudomonas aeruginosa group]|uniref:hypothetical protein n=1 Tax=Pseudomonas aeruginosa group TaxID=136841 RepID=UPI00071BF9C0|nr:MULTISPECIES: hypothetical protein [Pseudomonas aeruginosa group]KSC53284.1 hypothetical protein AO882_03080 [Pseudomonas paraeruginosa]KSL20765.1 hypothetical protein APA44_03080 [Pseudomonas aeruginosa]MBH8715247.1 hypothetical protein [Pseudomonas aeruginosa]MBH9341952.1 hypothetical protein [Pseudomonas aeruginosa]MBH9395448.1 hypothetical protein [Pseudomonas aeruginosa]
MKINAGTLQDYLAATFENAQDHASEPPQLMFMVEQMDQIFQREIFAPNFEADPTACLLAMNAYTMLLSAVRQALSGHLVSTYPIARTALESACYGFLIARDDAKADIWLHRHDSEKALRSCRVTFTVAKTVKELRSISPEMAEYVQAHYDASIDFGAHPNRKSVFDHLEYAGPAEDEMYGFELTGVYGRNSWHVNLGLLVCVEVGQAIAFLVAASAENHPLINERLDVFQDWMDAKNRMVEEINGEPINYTGPMYSSVIPPTAKTQ